MRPRSPGVASASWLPAALGAVGCSGGIAAIIPPVAEAGPGSGVDGVADAVAGWLGGVRRLSRAETTARMNRMAHATAGPYRSIQGRLGNSGNVQGWIGRVTGSFSGRRAADERRGGIVSRPFTS